MIRVKILRGLDLALDDAELYLTLSLDGLSKTSKLAARERPPPPAEETIAPAPSPPPAAGSSSDGSLSDQQPPQGHILIKRDSSFRLKELGWVWDEELDLLVPSRDKKDLAEIEVGCFDAQFRPRGKVKIPLARLAPNESVQQWYSFVETSNPKAAVLLKLTYIPEIAFPVIGAGKSATPTPRGLTPPPSAATPTGAAAGSSGATPGGNAVGGEPTRRDTAQSDVPDISQFSLPMGIADYFVIAGCSQETARQDRMKLLAKPRKKPHAFITQASGPIDELSQAYVIGPDAVTLSPVMLDRYPATDRPDVEFPTKAEMFLLPDGAEIVRTIPKSAKKPRFFTFVLVTNGVRTFGYCLESFEPLPKQNKVTDFEELYAPVVLCYLTRVPVPYTDFKWILERTYEARKRGWYERVLQTVVKGIPAPLPGVLSVTVDLISHEKRTIQLPPINDLPPLVFPSISKHTFDWFPLDDLIDLWVATLTEQKILVHSQNREALAMVSETLVQLMYPFKWENAYVPVLPTSLMQLFDAPIPCILGLRTDAMKMIPGGADTLHDHWIVIDADKCSVAFPRHEPLPQLPAELRARLHRSIRSAMTDRTLDETKKDRLIRLSFLECLASMLQGYRECFFVLSTDTDASTVFNRSQFFQRQEAQKLLHHAQINSFFQISAHQQLIGDGGRYFLDRFFDTTAFERFKVAQYDPETDFFHAVYAARRSKERERDQRSAALAALQGEAEQAINAAQSQPQSGVAVASSATTSVLTVAKVWNTRDSRWNRVGIEPIDTNHGKVARESARGTIDLESPLKIGEHVICKPFGNGVIAAINGDSSIVCVEFEGEWAARGYVQPDTLVRYDEAAAKKEAEDLESRLKEKTQVEEGEGGRKVRDDSSEHEDDETEDQTEKEGMEKEEETLATKINPENFEPDGSFSLVVGSSMEILSKVDPKQLKKSLVHYKRTLGIPLGNEEKPPSAPSAGTARKSANDAKMERAMHRAIINVFQDKPVPENDLRECGANLQSSQFARNMLIYVLKSQQSSHKTSDASWLATPGRGRRLGPEAFGSLYELFDSLLRACAAKEDFSNARCALEVSQFYYCEDDTLQNRLRGHVLWSKPIFWEYAFAEQVAISMDPSKSDAAPEPPSIANADAAAAEPLSVALAKFHEIGNRCEAQDLDAHKQRLFEHLSFFLHTMLNLDVSEEMARVFVDRVANIYSLEEDQKTILNMLITNISRAASYHIEEERAQAMQQAGVDEQTGSPNSMNSKRQIKKHYSVEAMTTTMVARFAGWRRGSSKGKSPNGGVAGGRRDSQTSQETN